MTWFLSGGVKKFFFFFDYVVRETLSKHGYRKIPGKAPMLESLAAAILIYVLLYESLQ